MSVFFIVLNVARQLLALRPFSDKLKLSWLFSIFQLISCFLENCRYQTVASVGSCGLVRSISVVVPAYNEESKICDALSKIIAAKLNASEMISVEVIVINDASTDLTLSVTEEFVSKYAETCSFKILNNQRNLGVGYAFWIGSKAASGEFVTLVPGDGVFSSESLGTLFCNFSTLGVTLTSRSNKHQRNRVRRLVSDALAVWFSWIVGKRVLDPHSLFVFPKKSVINAYKEIWPSISDDQSQRIGFEYHLRILQWILRVMPVSKTIEVEVISDLEKSSNSMQLKVLLSFFKQYGRMTLIRMWNPICRPSGSVLKSDQN